MDYSKKILKEDIVKLLQSRPGLTSGRYLGNPNNIQLYTPERISEMWEGICTAWVRFFRKEFPSLKNFARMVLCECAQESTMDYKLGVKPFTFANHESMGVIQCTPGSVLKDYHRWGTKINSVMKGRKDVVILDPEKTLKFDLADTCLSIVLWAWYTKSSVIMGVSMNEYGHRKAWNIQVGGTTQIYGNCLLTWLAGPRNDITKPNGKASFQDYYNRQLDYWVQSDFGTQAQFDANINVKLDPKLSFLLKECIDGTAK